MSWSDAYGLMRLLDEEHVGAPGRRAELQHEEAEIQRMQAQMGDMSGDR